MSKYKYDRQYFLDTINYIKSCNQDFTKLNEDTLYCRVYGLSQVYRNEKLENWPELDVLGEEYEAELVKLEEKISDLKGLKDDGISDENLRKGFDAIGGILDYKSSPVLPVEINETNGSSPNFKYQICVFLR